MFGFGAKVIVKPAVSGLAIWAGNNPIWAAGLGITSVAVVTVGLNRALNAMWADKTRKAALAAEQAAKDAVVDLKAASTEIKESASSVKDSVDKVVNTELELERAMKTHALELEAAFTKRAEAIIAVCDRLSGVTSKLHDQVHGHRAETIDKAQQQSGHNNGQPTGPIISATA